RRLPGFQGIPAAGPSACKETGASMTRQTESNCGSATSSPSWPRDEPSMGAAWESSAGSSNAPTVGSNNFAGSASAMIGFLPSITPSSNSLRPSSASALLTRGLVRRSKEEIVRRRGFRNVRLLSEQVAEFNYQPCACEEEYFIIVLRKQLVWERHGQVEEEETRYFFYITNQAAWSREEVVYFANDRCNQ